MRIHLVIDADICGDGRQLAVALRRLASNVEVYTNEELDGAPLRFDGPGIESGTVECRETGDDL